MTTSLSVDSQAIPLLASNIGLPVEKNMDSKPLSLSEWNALAEKLAPSSLQYQRAFFETDHIEWREKRNSI